MGIYNFKRRFAAPILEGKKRQTIRAVRTQPDKPGNVLHLYIGLRHPGATLLKRVRCTRVEEIRILETGQVYIAGVELDRVERAELARRDGFKDFEEMLSFWTTPKTRLPFVGHLIHWK